MADSVTSTYAGEAAGEYVAAALLSPKSLDGMTVKPNVKKKLVVKKGADSVALADATCDYTSAGDVTITERVLSVESFQINKTVCKQDFLDDWDAVSMGASAHNENAPSTFNQYFIDRLTSRTGEAIENNIWTGVDATAGQFSGFETLWAADSDVVDATAAAFSASTIDDALNTAIDNIPVTILGSSDLRIYMNTRSLWYYKQFLMANSHGGVNIFNGEIPVLSYAGIQIVECPGMSVNKLAIAEQTNLWFGTNLLDDMNEVKVIDTAETLGDQNIRYVMRASAGVQYGIGSEIVYINA